jgi:HD superfamily phosphohydrolase YqeK
MLRNPKFFKKVLADVLDMSEEKLILYFADKIEINKRERVRRKFMSVRKKSKNRGLKISSMDL